MCLVQDGSHSDCRLHPLRPNAPRGPDDRDRSLAQRVISRCLAPALALVVASGTTQAPWALATVLLSCLAGACHARGRVSKLIPTDRARGMAARAIDGAARRATLNGQACWRCASFMQACAATASTATGARAALRARGARGGGARGGFEVRVPVARVGSAAIRDAGAWCDHRRGARRAQARTLSRHAGRGAVHTKAGALTVRVHPRGHVAWTWRAGSTFNACNAALVRHQDVHCGRGTLRELSTFSCPPPLGLLHAPSSCSFSLRPVAKSLDLLFTPMRVSGAPSTTRGRSLGGVPGGGVRCSQLAGGTNPRGWVGWSLPRTSGDHEEAVLARSYLHLGRPFLVGVFLHGPALLQRPFRHSHRGLGRGGQFDFQLAQLRRLLLRPGGPAGGGAVS